MKINKNILYYMWLDYLLLLQLPLVILKMIYLAKREGIILVGLYQKVILYNILLERIPILLVDRLLPAMLCNIIVESKEIKPTGIMVKKLIKEVENIDLIFNAKHTCSNDNYVEFDSSLLPYLYIGENQLTSKGSFWSLGRYTIFVYSSPIKTLSKGGVGAFYSNCLSSNITVHNNGVGKTNLDINKDVSKVSVENNGVGNVEIKGLSVNNIDIINNGVGNIVLDFYAASGKIESNSVGDIKLKKGSNISIMKNSITGSVIINNQEIELEE